MNRYIFYIELEYNYSIVSCIIFYIELEYILYRGL